MVRSPLFSHVIRSMARMKARMLAMAAVCALAFGAIAGAYSAFDALQATVVRLQSTSQVAELEVRVAPDDARNLPSFDDIAGVQATERRLLASGQFRTARGDTVTVLYVGADPAQFTRINTLLPLAGTLPRADDPTGVAVERSCATHHRVGVGDALALRIGGADYATNVVSVVQSPEFLVAPANPSVYVPAAGSLCVVFGPARLVHERLGFDAFNSLLFRFDEQDMARLRPLIQARAQSRLAVEFSVARPEQFSRRFLDLHLGAFRVFVPAVVVVFAVSAVLVIFFLMTQWVRAERTVVAMMLTLGYGRARLLAAYAMPAVVVAVAGVALGLGAAWLDLHMLGTGYARAIGMPDPDLALGTRHLVDALAVVGAAVACGMALPLRAVLRLAPVEGVRSAPDARAGRAERLVQRIGGPVWLRYPMRNLARSGRLSLASIGAFAATLAAVIACYVSTTSIERMAAGSFAADRWQVLVDLETPMWTEELDRLRSAMPRGEWSTFVRGAAQVHSGGRIDNLSLTGVAPGAPARSPVLLAGRGLAPGDEDAIVVERRMAADHGLTVGDRLPVTALGTAHAIRIVGIHSSAVPGEAMVPLSLAQRILDLEDRVTGAFLNAPDAARAELDALHATPGVLAVTTKQRILDDVQSLSGQLIVITHQSAAISIAVSLLLLFASTAFAIVGRRAEYATLRLLGHPDRTVAAIVMLEVMVIAAIACALAIPLGWLLGTVLNDRLAGVWFKVVTSASVVDFARVLLPALLIAPLVALPSLRLVLGLRPTDTLNERRLG